MLEPIIIDENTTINFKFDEFYPYFSSKKERKFDYGIFFRKEKMYPLSTVEQPKQIRTYTMRLILSASRDTRVKSENCKPKTTKTKKIPESLLYLKELAEIKELEKKIKSLQPNEPPPYTVESTIAREPILFYFSDDLSLFFKTATHKCFCADRGERYACRMCNSSRTYQTTKYDYQEILEKHDQKFLKLLKERLIRKLNPNKIPPKIHDYSEFIWFDDITAQEWGPPEELTENGKTRYYCKASIHETDYYRGKPYGIINPKNFSAYDLPHGFVIPGMQEKDQANQVYGLSKKERIKLFDTLPEYVKNHIFRRLLQPRFDSIEQRIQSQMPWFLHLTGLDDCSYTKWFPTRKLAEKELQRLRQLQPCHFFRDVRNRKYVFTN